MSVIDIKPRVADYQAAALFNQFEHFAFIGGVAAGKTFTGSHWSIMQILEHPELTGLIGANTYDQLSQATLRELFYWLESYGIPYVVDRRPPASWGQTRRAFKSYNNTLSLRVVPGVITTIFTRVMSAGNPIRGIEFSWYWLDESRDTPRNTFDVILSRLRESEYRRGLVTTTTNGEDWVYKTFVAGRSRNRGAMHVPTEHAVRCGFITPEYYQMLLENYDPLFAEQELFARHVDVLGGRAYYAFSKKNAAPCPWGDEEPNPDRPLIVGEDFNFDPAPMVWVVGQLGPDNTEWQDCIHWFGEVEGRQTSTRTQTRNLVDQFGRQFFYQCYGDASGGRGSTSNAGDTDYSQQAEEFDAMGVGWTIDFDHANPRVIDRVQNMNRLAKNANGKISMTFDRARCPRLAVDVAKVGWRKTLQGKGKLDDKGDHNMTHASDAVGYAVWKVLPFIHRSEMPAPVGGSSALADIRNNI